MSRSTLQKLEKWLGEHEAGVTKALTGPSWLRGSDSIDLYKVGKFGAAAVGRGATNEVDLVFVYFPTVGKFHDGRNMLVQTPASTLTLTVKNTHLVSDEYTVDANELVEAVMGLIAQGEARGSVKCSKHIKICRD